ncbi:broad substrate specificity ATP-binding cassette transporter ABCG2-like [Callospermophilus lateralis]|uniref:broad substrate specificity ATP-binding cassette transporter ABCG2-like n=1 Tax=Callospermophilus lateralis TaxID=76772 RepID=UPI004053ABFA
MSSSNDQDYIPFLQRSNSDLPEMTSRDLKTFPEGAVLSFHNLCYREKVKSGFLFCRKTVEKKLLSNINGIMKPGLNAILAHQSRGKSLLLNILAARRDASGLSGDVLINGAPQSDNFKCNLGYVVQDDIVMGTLTVRENLLFSAALGLPTAMTNHEKNERINKVIEDLDLDKVANSKVLSRGERKRTRIAMELITDPPILFLDKPTTGLDLSTTNAVLLLLKRISQQGRTVIFSIHRPHYFIFKLFDSLTILSSGKLIYHGPAQKALEYLSSAGYSCEPHNDPADFFLDVIYGISSAVVLNREEEDHEVSHNEEFPKREKTVSKTLAEFYANSSLYKDTKAELEELSGGLKKRSPAFMETTYVTSFCHQLRWISWRSFKNLLPNYRTSIERIITTIIGGLVTSSILLHLKNDCTEIQIRTWTLCLLIGFQCLPNLSAKETFALEKKLFIQEYISGYYRVSSYFFGKLLSDFLPRSLLTIILFTCTVYFMLGLNPGVKSFFITMLTILMVAYSTGSLILAIGVHSIFFTAAILGLYFLLMMILISFSLDFGNFAPWLSWIQYLSIPHYGYMALQYNEFWGQNFCPGLNTTKSSGCSTYVICTGEEYLTVQGIDPSPWSLWKNHLALACITTILLAITYLKLLLLKKKILKIPFNLP